jgi:hypothetical protein
MPAAKSCHGSASFVSGINEDAAQHDSQHDDGDFEGAIS